MEIFLSFVLEAKPAMLSDLLILCPGGRVCDPPRAEQFLHGDVQLHRNVEGYHSTGWAGEHAEHDQDICHHT